MAGENFNFRQLWHDISAAGSLWRLLVRVPLAKNFRHDKSAALGSRRLPLICVLAAQEGKHFLVGRLRKLLVILSRGTAGRLRRAGRYFVGDVRQPFPSAGSGYGCGHSLHSPPLCRKNQRLKQGEAQDNVPERRPPAPLVSKWSTGSMVAQTFLSNGTRIWHRCS